MDLGVNNLPTLQQMLTSLMSNLTQIDRLIEAIAYLSGMLFVWRALYTLKEYGELRTMMSSQTDFRKPALLFIVGAILLYLPTGYQIGMGTFFAQEAASPLAYKTQNYGSWQGMVYVVERIIQAFGLIAFIRGWMIVSGLSGQGSPPGGFGKAMMHIIGGIFAMNISGTMSILSNTLGFSS